MEDITNLPPTFIIQFKQLRVEFYKSTKKFLSSTVKWKFWNFDRLKDIKEELLQKLSLIFSR
jgi:hypothetical protein